MATQEVDDLVADLFGDDTPPPSPGPSPGPSPRVSPGSSPGPRPPSPAPDTAPAALATQDTAQLEHDLFGGDEEEDSTPAARAATQATQAAEAATLEQDLFGDFDSGDEGAKPAATAEAAPGGRLKRPQPADGGDAGAAADGAQPPPERPRKKRRRDLSKFADLEAEEAAGDSEEDLEEADLDDLIDTGPDEMGEKSQAELRRAMQQQQAELEEASLGAAATGLQSGARRVFGSSFLDALEEKFKKAEEEGAAAPLGQKAAEPAQSKTSFIVPEPKDPKLWMTKTFAPEIELCISAMVKAGECMEAGKPIPISSVFFSPHLRGYVYIESDNENNIRQFTQGIRGFSSWGISLVPTNQMPQVFEASHLISSKKTILKVGDWVRMARGLYKGDLGQVDEIKDLTCIVKLKPRLNLNLEKAATAKGKQDRAAKQRPPPRWFNKADVESSLIVNVDRRITPRGLEYYFVVDKDYFRDGFLYKEMRSSFFIAGDQVRPQEHELQDRRAAPPPSENTRPGLDFERGKKEEPKEMPPPPIVPKKKAVIERQQLEVGDAVIVTTGDVKNLKAVVTQSLFQSPTVLVQPTDPPSAGHLSMEVAILSKYFSVGDYVKVLAGEHEGDTGFVIKIAFHKPGKWDYNTAAVVLSSTCSDEYQVRVDHLQLTSEKADPQDDIGEFQTGQLVRLDGQNDSRGVIVRIEANARAHVLGTDNRTRIMDFALLSPVSLPSKGEYERQMWTLDRKGQKISPGCVVKAPQGSVRSAPIKAMVQFIHDNYLFLQATEALTGERAYSVCHGSKCEFVWSKNDQKDKQREKEKEKLGDTAGALGVITYGISMASETSWLRPHFQQMLGLKDTKTSLVKGCNVRIHGGGYKGLRAEVRDNLGDQVRLSLLCVPKIIVVPIEHVAPDDYYLKKPKEQRWPPKKPVPGTPPAEVQAPGPGTPDVLLKDLGDGEIREEDMWNPHFMKDSAEVAALKDKPPPPERPVSPEKPVPPSGTMDSIAPTGEDTEMATSAGKRRKRMARLPEVSLPEPSLLQSPSALVFKEPRSEAAARAPWLMVGLGVEYTWDGVKKMGWIRKVYDNLAYVMPADVPFHDDNLMVGVNESQTKPLEPTEAGEEVIVYDGPRRGVRGKVIGFEATAGSVYIRLSSANKGKNAALFDLASGSTLLRTEKKDVAKFSSPQVQPALPEQPSKPAEPTSLGFAEETEPAERPLKRIREEPTEQPSGTAAAADEETEWAHAGVFSGLATSPATIPATPASLAMPATPKPLPATPKPEVSMLPPGAVTPALPEEEWQSPAEVASGAGIAKGSETPLLQTSDSAGRLTQTPADAKLAVKAQEGEAHLPKTPAAALGNLPKTPAAALGSHLPQTPAAALLSQPAAVLPQTPADAGRTLPQTPADARPAAKAQEGKARLPQTPAAALGSVPQTAAAALSGQPPGLTAPSVLPMTPPVPELMRAPAGSSALLPSTPPIPGLLVTPAGLSTHTPATPAGLAAPALLPSTPPVPGLPVTPAGAAGKPYHATPSTVLPTTPAGLVEGVTLPTTPAGLTGAPPSTLAGLAAQRPSGAPAGPASEPHA